VLRYQVSAPSLPHSELRVGWDLPTGCDTDTDDRGAGQVMILDTPQGDYESEACNVLESVASDVRAPSSQEATRDLIFNALDTDGGAAAAVGSFVAAVGTESYLCNICSCQEMLRRNGRG
jgi:hypothetical protein